MCLFDKHAHFTMQRKEHQEGKEGDKKIRPRMDFENRKELCNPQVSHTKYQIQKFLIQNLPCSMLCVPNRLMATVGQHRAQDRMDVCTKPTSSCTRSMQVHKKIVNRWRWQPERSRCWLCAAVQIQGRVDWISCLWGKLGLQFYYIQCGANVHIHLWGCRAMALNGRFLHSSKCEALSVPTCGSGSELKF